MDHYVQRLVEPRLAMLTGAFAAVSLVGPRACGKTTLAARHAADVVRLDRPPERAAFDIDADEALHPLARPALLDEWQEAPQVLGAVKRAVDADDAPGQFILTGSVRAELDVATWPGTGRVVRLPLRGFSERELEGTTDAPLFLDRLREQDFSFNALHPPVGVTSYLDRATRGSLPAAVSTAEPGARQLWHETYLDTVASRDARDVGGRVNTRSLRRFIDVVALQTAGIPDNITVANAAGIDRRTTETYLTILEDVFMLQRLPAWSTHRLQRLTSRPKLVFSDTGLACAAAGVGSDALLRHGDLLGRLTETFVINQLVAELPVASHRPRLFHLRTRDRREVDVVVEYGGGLVAGIEIKATTSPQRNHARHLEWLGSQLGDAFLGGVVLHSGTAVGELAPGIHALPHAALWSA